ncbi:MAG TPA: cytochrome b N-terminal domain-containing protein [Streptosporangiaceae bacterium]|nr:cytochrome b N-terminal domain-containing protein [Streptosporangiaceae bacterium]
MNSSVLADPGSGVINLDQPGTYLHWSIFNVSVANLVLIAVMVVIFGAALLLPFPKGRTFPPEEGPPTDSDPYAEPTARNTAVQADGTQDDEDARMWTARVRRRALTLLPPGKLLPDRQPAYVASWVYVFGVASLAAFGVAVVSGFAIAVGGTDWWHTNVVGRFFNSLHLWSVELFMALIVIHLWGKFWMAAWRGRRAATWITGVVAFIAAIVECFTGYLSQQNFDSQWISTNGKDAINASGAGAFFNLLNFGQMLLWHVVLIPIILVALVGGHILLVRMRGVSHPIDSDIPARDKGSWRQRERVAARVGSGPWRGATRRYDILKEGTIASAVVLALVFVLASILSSPDVPSVTIQTWSQIAPADFLGTAAAELNATSKTATYGPPYNNQTGSVQQLLISPPKITGVTLPINTAADFVTGPLSKLARTDPPLATALATYQAAPASQQLAWANAYANVVTKVRFAGGSPVVPRANDGPVPTMLAAELNLARSGALDTDLLADRTFYGTDFTKPLLFIEDGQYFANKAQAMNLTGSQWGVMNETGSYPGQPWLWLYTLWYQINPIGTSPNADIIAIALTGLATLLLLAVPFIPGLRDIPRWVPVHRLIWRPQPAPARPDGTGGAGSGDGTRPAQTPTTT